MQRLATFPQFCFSWLCIQILVESVGESGQALSVCVYRMDDVLTFQPGPEPWPPCLECRSPCTSCRPSRCTGWLPASSFVPVAQQIKCSCNRRIHIDIRSKQIVYLYHNTHFQHHSGLFNSPGKRNKKSYFTEGWGIFLFVV